MNAFPGAGVICLPTLRRRCCSEPPWKSSRAESSYPKGLGIDRAAGSNRKPMQRLSIAMEVPFFARRAHLVDAVTLLPYLERFRAKNGNPTLLRLVPGRVQANDS